MKHPVVFLELSLLLTSAVVAVIVYVFGMLLFPAAAVVNLALTVGAAAGLIAFVIAFRVILR